MRRLILILFCAWAASGTRGVLAQEVDASLLNGLAWRGPGATLQDLSGKTVVIVNYVTWCPKCDAWSGEMLTQLRQAAEGKPVIIIAVCTDEDAMPGPVYMSQRNFAGTNILHAFHPGMHDRIGVDRRELFTAMIIGPDRRVVWKGPAGTYSPMGDAKDYSVGRRVRTGRNLGEFTIISPEMPADVKALLWPMEMGQVIPGPVLNRAKSKLAGDGRAALDAAVDAFVKKQFAQITELQQGEIPQQMLAVAKAELLSKNYPATEEGKEARQLWSEMNRDPDFRKELAAQKAYEQLLEQLPRLTSIRRVGQLTNFAKRHQGTYFAKLAQEQIELEQSDRDSAAEPPLDR